MHLSIKKPGYLERTRVLDFVGAASSRDRFNSRLEAAPTGVFFSYLGVPDKRIKKLMLNPPLRSNAASERKMHFGDGF